MAAAEVLAPGPDHVGVSAFPWGRGIAAGLYEHPPARIAVAMPPEGADAPRLRFRPALLPAASASEPDGVWFALLSGDDLIYCRYLHPRAQPADQRIAATTAALGCRDQDCGLTLATLPGPSPDYDQAGWADLRRSDAGWAGLGGWKQIVDGDPRLYVNQAALSRAFLVGRAELWSESEALAALAGGSVDPRGTVLISGAAELPGAGPEAEAGAPGRLAKIEYDAQRVAVEAELSRPGWLVVADLAYPGWRAWVDGVETRVERADYCLRAVPLAAGARRIELAYVPSSFRIGLGALIGGLLAALAAGVVRARPGWALNLRRTRL
jgi:hypothetical protein